MNPQRPGGGIPGLTERPALQERVKQQFGQFRSMPEGAEVEPYDNGFDERAVLADDFLKPTLWILGGVFLASLFAWVASSPNFDAPNVWANSFRFDTALVIVWGPLLAWTMARRSLRRAVRTYLILSLFIEPFSEAMFREMNGGFWDTVIWPAAVAWYGTVKEWSGVPGASLPVFFIVTVGLLYRAVWGKRARPEPPPRFARNLALFFLGTVAALSAWGIAHGGVVQGTFRQTVHLMQLPLVALLFLYALEVPEDLAAIGTIFVVTALARAGLVIFVYVGVALPAGIVDQPDKFEWCTTHSDTVLFVTGILIVVTHAFERRTKRTILRAAGVTAVIVVAILMNNRRLAFVSLAIAPATVYLALAPSKRKRRVTMLLALAVPVTIGYLLVGSELDTASPIFKPAKLVMSMLDQKDLSSLSRDIENENLVYTLRQNALLPTGFGFDYQFSPDNPPMDLTDQFADFRLIAHNGVLWMWSFGGLIGFTALWLIFPVAGTLARRGYLNASTALERSAALSALGVVAVCIVQVWGDQGINGYMTLVTFGVAFAVATRLSVRA